MQLSEYDEYLVSVAEEISFYLRKSGVNPDDAKEVSQDILIKLLESDIVLPPDKLRAWMYRTAIRHYIDRYRRDKRYYELLQKSFFTGINDSPYDDRQFEPLYDVMKQLPNAYQTVIDLYYFQQLTVKEIALLLGNSISKTKIDLMRGRKHLRQLLEKEGYVYEDFISF